MHQYQNGETHTEAAASAAQQKAAEMTDQATDQIVATTTSVVREKRNAAADYVKSLGSATSAAAESLSRDGCGQTAQRLESVSSFLNDTGRSISSYDVRSVIEDASNVARRNPALTFGLAALAGYAIVKMANAQPAYPKHQEGPSHD